jgi:hypothetical protein
MTTRLKFWLPMTAAFLIFFPAAIASAQDAPAAGSGQTRGSALSGLLDLFGSTGLPSLSGLIQPEKMGVLTDNPLTVRDNSVETQLLSGNETKVMSDIRILSGITVNIHVHIAPGKPAKTERQADKPPRKQKTEQTPQRKTDRRSQQ